MELNAYVFAMTLTGVTRYHEDRQVVPEPEFKPFDLRYLRSLPVNANQPRGTARDGEPRRDLSTSAEGQVRCDALNRQTSLHIESIAKIPAIDC
jgi:hypothetical protein